MRINDPHLLKNLADDIELELSQLTKLEAGIKQTQRDIQEAPAYRTSFYENLAFKFHNFYTGCERIFSLIATTLNGGVPKDSAWHRRLLQKMEAPQGERKAVISTEVRKALDEFLRFRHVIRNVYGFELDIERLDVLLKKYPEAWELFERDLRVFVQWLRALATELEKVGIE